MECSAGTRVEFDHSHLSFIYPVKAVMERLIFIYISLHAVIPLKFLLSLNIHTACWLLSLKLTSNNRYFSTMDIYFNCLPLCVPSVWRGAHSVF